jgi:hypothetical protein
MVSHGGAETRSSGADVDTAFQALFAELGRYPNRVPGVGGQPLSNTIRLRISISYLSASP